MAALPLFYVDFNELMDIDVVLFSKTDVRKDASGNDVHISEGLEVAIYSDDIGLDGKPDNLIAEGVVIPNTFTKHFANVKWCCRINWKGIRHQSDVTDVT